MNLPGRPAVHAEKARIVRRQTRTPSSRARFESMPKAFSQPPSTRVDRSLVTQALSRQFLNKSSSLYDHLYRESVVNYVAVISGVGFVGLRFSRRIRCPAH